MSATLGIPSSITTLSSYMMLTVETSTGVYVFAQHCRMNMSENGKASLGTHHASGSMRTRYVGSHDNTHALVATLFELCRSRPQVDCMSRLAAPREVLYQETSNSFHIGPSLGLSATHDNDMTQVVRKVIEKRGCKVDHHRRMSQGMTLQPLILGGSRQSEADGGIVLLHSCLQG